MADQDIIPASAVALAHAPSPLTAIRSVFAQPAVRRSLPLMGTSGSILLAGLAWWAFQTPPQRPLFEGLGDADKGAVANALQSASIAYAVDRDTGAITVGDDSFHKARMLLAAQGLPKSAPAGDRMMSALPMGASRAVEGETLRSAREADLARTIEAIDAVASARVHLAIADPSPFVRDKLQPAASVMLRLETGRALSAAQVQAIKHLVASSVTGLSPDQISIVDQSGQLLSQQGALADDPNLKLQTALEDRYRQSLIALLGPVIGQGNFTAEVHADLDNSESQSTRESFPKDDRALRSEQGNRTSNASATTPAIGIPGALSNQPPPATQVSTTPSGSVTVTAPTGTGASEENYTRSFDVGREISVTHQPVGRLRRLSVAVALRDVKGAKPRSKAELLALENLVKGAVGFDATRGDVVALSSRSFAEAETTEPAWWDRPWLGSAVRQALALIAALLAFLFLGRPLIRQMRAAASNAGSDAELERQLLGTSANRAITLDMIDAAPSYEARAALVRSFVKQDAARAARVVSQLMQDGGSRGGH
jgi:flagellar M-ring protein FliF